MKFRRPQRVRPVRLPARGSLRRGVYLLPTLFTVANMGFGFAATLAALHDRFLLAGWLIVLAGLCDGLDGRIARLTHSTSEFGKEYDSLADVVSFGMAPALLAYQWSLRSLGRWGWFVAFLFLVAGSVRLARFNIKVHTTDRRFFMGLPIPGGAGALTVLVLVHPEPLMSRPASLLVWGYVLAVSLLMVSTIPYRTFKTVNLRQRRPYTTVFAMALVIALLAVFREEAMAALLGVYLLAGPLESGWRRLSGHPINLVVDGEAREVPGASDTDIDADRT
ncbi:MAG: CDP-diacylglycerol--serine O-phosphatidyltransferase [Thermoanaerobaculaceae bacterium]|jgi:CDP-diacylglycerol--serine O-phosphatidyltransferase|nr:CDP-diacylglycerol--serine O-phosphatidyltransferase [Thermoanaerobaculaceae bacterium]